MFRLSMRAILVFLFTHTTAAFADPRLDVSTNKGMAYFKVSENPGVFRLLTQGYPAATRLGLNFWVVPIPSQGLPPLSWQVGTQVHTTPPIPGR